MSAEPVAITEAVKTLLIATLALLLGFEVIDMTDAQMALILGFYGAVALVVQVLFVRNAVTPNQNVAVRKGDDGG